MVKKLLIGLLLVLVIASTLLASCKSSTSSSTTSTQQSTTSTQTSPKPQSTSTSTVTTTSTSTQANWWDKFGTPQYGGEMVVWAGAVNGGSFDPDVGFGLSAGVPGPRGLYFEPLVTLDWALDRNTWAYQTGFTPVKYMTGAVAESWEQKDATTIVMHIRQGVYWHNRAPVNGREFTAQDIQYSFDRVLGTGSGFTEPNPAIAGMYSTVSSVTTTDKYTVEFKLKNPSVMGLYQVLADQAGLVAQEWDKQADHNDWKSVIGTGAFVLSDFQVGTSMSYTKNPNYWAFDARYPKNKLPYLDTVKTIAIPDINTALASMRTGKIDIINDPMGGPNWQQGKSLAQTNPDMQIAFVPQSAQAIIFRNDTKPFTDIKVRKALQMAVDIPSIAKSYYGGTVNGEPVGLISPNLTGWTTPYSQWSQSLKDEYTYNPTKAKALLAEAGYPDGFKTNVVVAQGEDVALLEIVKAEFAEIGVDMTINAMDMVTARNLMGSGKQDQMVMDKEAGNPGPITNNLNARRSGDARNYSFNNDATYDAMLEKASTATTEAEFQKAVVAMDMYVIQQHWAVNFCSTVQPAVWQPWLKGYSGEFGIGQFLYYLWVDPSLKK
jgi:peptide/nickel transport system substrate-binding protein